MKRLLPLCVLAASLSGCGDGRPSLVPVDGTVLLDGKPIEGATVMFKPLEVDAEGFGRPAVALTDASGKFSLMTYEPGDGVPPGKYSVGISKEELVGELPPNYNPEMPDASSVRYKMIIPGRYANPANSGLTATVTSDGLDTPEFKLESGGRQPEVKLTGPQRRANEP